MTAPSTVAQTPAPAGSQNKATPEYKLRPFPYSPGQSVTIPVLDKTEGFIVLMPISSVEPGTVCARLADLVCRSAELSLQYEPSGQGMMIVDVPRGTPRPTEDELNAWFATLPRNTLPPPPVVVKPAS